MKVSETMTRDVVLATPNQSICEAAKMMAEHDSGSLPVADSDRLIGVITDRDIAVRAVAKHLSPDTSVRDVMSKDVLYCFEDEDVEHVARNMGENQVRRLPVVSRDKRLVGIVSFADVSRAVKAGTAGKAIADISKPGGAQSRAGAH
jgi:CBS domain-containing protein